MLDPLVDRQPGEVRRSQPRGGRDDQGDHHHHHPPPVGPQQAEHPAQLARALVLAPDQPPEVPTSRRRRPAGALADSASSSVASATSDPWVSGSALGRRHRRRGSVVARSRRSQPCHLLALARGRAAGRPSPPCRARRSPRTAGSARAAPRACRGRRFGPPSMTTISSASEIVDIRWATMNVVRPAITSRRPRLIAASVARRPTRSRRRGSGSAGRRAAPGRSRSAGAARPRASGRARRPASRSRRGAAR